MLTKRAKPADTKRLRFEIAKDVLARFDEFSPINGVWLNIKPKPGTTINKAGDLDEAVTLVRERKAECAACAIGACLMALADYEAVELPLEFRSSSGTIARNNDNHLIFGEGAYKFVGSKIGVAQATLIELAFEGNDSARFRAKRFANMLTDEDIAAAVAFGHKYGEPKERLHAIMENIIRNHGDFCPRDGRTDPVSWETSKWEDA